MSTDTDTDSDDVIIEWTIEAGRRDYRDTFTIPRAEWDAMTPAERVQSCEDELEVNLGNCVSQGWHIVSGATDDDIEVPSATPPAQPAPVDLPLVDLLVHELLNRDFVAAEPYTIAGDIVTSYTYGGHPDPYGNVLSPDAKVTFTYLNLGDDEIDTDNPLVDVTGPGTSGLIRIPPGTPAPVALLVMRTVLEGAESATESLAAIDADR